MMSDVNIPDAWEDGPPMQVPPDEANVEPHAGGGPRDHF